MSAQLAEMGELLPHPKYPILQELHVCRLPQDPNLCRNAENAIRAQISGSLSPLTGNSTRHLRLQGGRIPVDLLLSLSTVEVLLTLSAESLSDPDLHPLPLSPCSAMTEEWRIPAPPILLGQGYAGCLSLLIFCTLSSPGGSNQPFVA